MIFLYFASCVFAMSSNFMKTNGAQLEVNGKPFNIRGVNSYYIANVINQYNCAQAAKSYQEHLEFLSSYFKTAKQMYFKLIIFNTYSGINTVRFWAFQGMTTVDSKGIIDFTYINNVITAASKEGVYVVPTLKNMWGNS